MPTHPHSTVDGVAPKPSVWALIGRILGRGEPKDDGLGAAAENQSVLSPLESELVECCRRLGAENAQLRAAAGLPASDNDGAKVAAMDSVPQCAAADVNWEEAFWSMHAELESLRLDREALLKEVQGRKRSQHGSRSERIRPEELLVAMRQLAATEPERIPEGMLEELEHDCAEREAARQRRKKKQQEKRRIAAENEARRAAAKLGETDPDDDGGGSGARKRPTGSPTSDAGKSAQVIPLRRVGHRNACLAGMEPEDKIIPVAVADRICPICEAERKVFDFQDSHMLDVVLPSLRHLRLRQEKRSCPLHPDAGVAVAPAVERPIAQALPTALLLAFMVVAKMQDHLPLERLSGMFRRWGCRVPPSTLGGWFQAAGDLVIPLAEHLGKAVLNSDKCMNTDGTYIRVIDPAAPRGSTNASLWGYTVADIGTYFRYTQDGSYDDTRANLSARTGPTMTDGHKGYVSQRMPDSKTTIPVINGPHLNCFDHARRPLEEAFRLDGDTRASLVLYRIQSLYRVEAEAKKDGLQPEQIKALRDAKSRPIFDKLFAELVDLKLWVTPKSRLGRAIATMLRRKVHLEAYLSNGAWPISNVLQETQFRSKAIGQHNWLFLGSHESAPRYAALLTLVRSCAILDVDPAAYLADIFMRLQKRGSAKRLDDLLPAAWKRAQTAIQSHTSVAA